MRSIKRNRMIKKVIHRLIGEEFEKLKLISEKTSILNHQAEHFEIMSETVQDSVIVEMFALMNKNEWYDWVKELKAELEVLDEVDE